MMKSEEVHIGIQLDSVGGEQDVSQINTKTFEGKQYCTAQGEVEIRFKEQAARELIDALERLGAL